MSIQSAFVCTLAGLAVGFVSPALGAEAAPKTPKPVKKSAAELSTKRGGADRGAEPPQRPQRRSLNQRGAVPAPKINPNAQHPQGLAVFPNEFRTIDGVFNNAAEPEWGAAGIELIRVMTPDYGDGSGSPAGAGRISPREISNIMCAQGGLVMNNAMAHTDFVWQWGQFLDHDIDETPIANPHEDFDIPVPLGDAWFDPTATGIETIPLDRSAYRMIEGVRQQLNNITSYIDASNVYGASEERANELRALDGTGKLKVSAGNLLPFNVNGLDNAPTGMDPSFFLAGDIRANEQVGLTAMHTLFMREHNRHAEAIALANPGLTGDEIYERARAMVAAEIQSITFNEFLPRLLGSAAFPEYTGYNPSVNAGISNLFATAAYRVGHTMLSPRIMRLDASGNESAEGHIALSSAFFSPAQISNNGIESLLRGLAGQPAQNVDVFIIDDVRNLLFGQPGLGGFDLGSLNLQRGRDHGLPSYNQIRVAYGRAAVTAFDQINPDVDVASRLGQAYTDVDQIDAWVGLLAEPHRGDAFVGETLYRVLQDQFLRLRDGDRFWYESYLPADLVEQVESTTLAQIIRFNTEIDTEIQDDVFTMSLGCIADFAAPTGILDFFDISAFLDLYTSSDPSADLTGDGEFDYFDISAFINAYNTGCAF